MRLLNSIPQLWHDSLSLSFKILGGLAIILGFTSISPSDFLGRWGVGWQIAIEISVFAVITVVARIAIGNASKDGIELTIRNMSVAIRPGNLLRAEGWKIIAFNERFDTNVDGDCISDETINGHYINELPSDMKKFLRQAIELENSSPFLRQTSADGAITYELGTIKTFDTVMMLAFTHFDERNNAYIRYDEYENVLRKMWLEIHRVYQGKPVNLPLIGGGITRIEGLPEKNEGKLLDTILRTLKDCTSVSLTSTGGHPEITIILTKSAMSKIDFADIRKRYDERR